MKVLVTIGLNMLSSLHIPSWHITFSSVSYFLSEILGVPDNDRNKNFEICCSLFFSKKSQRYHHLIVKSMKKIFKFGQLRKFCCIESKTSVLSFCEYIFNANIGRKINKINIERKNTSSQWLIPFQ